MGNTDVLIGGHLLGVPSTPLWTHRVPHEASHRPRRLPLLSFLLQKCKVPVSEVQKRATVFMLYHCGIYLRLALDGRESCINVAQAVVAVHTLDSGAYLCYHSHAMLDSPDPSRTQIVNKTHINANQAAVHFTKIGSSFHNLLNQTFSVKKCLQKMHSWRG